jgi:hypothetical protein
LLKLTGIIYRSGLIHLSRIIIVLAMVQILKAQEMPGLVNSNFAGVSSALINPANLILSKNYFDIQPIAIQSFTQNNLVYIPGEDYKITNFLDPENELPKYPPDNNNFLYYRNSFDKFAFNQQRIIGPSGMIMYGDRALAIHTAARTHLSATNIPYEIGVFSIEGLRYDPLFNVNFWSKNERVAAMAWGEIGLSYAWAFKKKFRDHWSAGITVKRILGHSAGFMKVEELDYIVLNDSTINIRSLTADAGFSVPVDYDSNDFPDEGPFFKGGGFGLDLGLTFTRMKQGFQRYNPDQLCEYPYSDYEYRLGVSILDFGAARFDNHSQLHRFEDVSLFWMNYDSVNYTNLNQMAREFSELFSGDPDASLMAERFTLGLPTAVSVQFDYHYRRNIYLNATWVQALPVWKYSLIRPSQIAFTPRYETDWFEFSLPLSLFQYRFPRVGASMRIGYLTVGTERLGTWLGMADLSGIDFYASFKFNLRKGKCLKKRTTDYCPNEEYGYSKKQLRLFKKRVK